MLLSGPRWDIVVGGTGELRDLFARALFGGGYTGKLRLPMAPIQSGSTIGELLEPGLHPFAGKPA